MTLRIVWVVLAGVLASAQPVVIKTSTIIDGRGHILKNRQIVVDGSKIVSVTAAQGKPAYDLTGLTVMPGWIDTHVHIGWFFNQKDRLDQGSGTTAAQAALYAEGNAYQT